VRSGGGGVAERTGKPASQSGRADRPQRAGAVRRRQRRRADGQTGGGGRVRSGGGSVAERTGRPAAAGGCGQAAVASQSGRAARRPVIPRPARDQRPPRGEVHLPATPAPPIPRPSLIVKNVCMDSGDIRVRMPSSVPQHSRSALGNGLGCFRPVGSGLLPGLNLPTAKGNGVTPRSGLL
jgi:hypothetical protein